MSRREPRAATASPESGAGRLERDFTAVSLSGPDRRGPCGREAGAAERGPAPPPDQGEVISRTRTAAPRNTATAAGRRRIRRILAAEPKGNLIAA